MIQTLKLTERGLFGAVDAFCGWWSGGAVGVGEGVGVQAAANLAFPEHEDGVVLHGR